MVESSFANGVRLKGSTRRDTPDEGSRQPLAHRVGLGGSHGLRDFGKVYSSLFAAFALAGALGPLIMGAG
jgi:hypothetical protein